MVMLAGSFTCTVMKNDICGMAYGRDHISGYGARTKYTVNYATTKSACAYNIIMLETVWL